MILKRTLLSSLFILSATSTLSTYAADSLLFSPYKDTSINMNWNTNVIQTNVMGSPKALVDVLPSGQPVSLAFATGTCGNENFGGVPGVDLAKANIPKLVDKNIPYVISTGGAAGAFQCNSKENLEAMIDRYQSPLFLGLDYDIEGGYSVDDIKNLMSTTAQVQQDRPDLRVSLTLATLATPGNPNQEMLNILGQSAIQAAKDANLKFNVNLMVMDYGATNCIINTSGRCDMALSAEQAAEALHEHYDIPYHQIELTPMIGQNDTSDEVTSVEDMSKIAQFAKLQGLAGVHYWSFDRDIGCTSSWASPTCSGINQDHPLAFEQAVLNEIPNS